MTRLLFLLSRWSCDNMSPFDDLPLKCQFCDWGFLFYVTQFLSRRIETVAGHIIGRSQKFPSFILHRPMLYYQQKER